MSRRKQANPRPIKLVDEDQDGASKQGSDKPLVMLAADSTEEGVSEQEFDDDDDYPSRLVIDTPPERPTSPPSSLSSAHNIPSLKSSPQHAHSSSTAIMAPGTESSLAAHLTSNTDSNRLSQINDRVDDGSTMSNLLQSHSVSMESLAQETASNTGSQSSGKKNTRRGRKSDKILPVSAEDGESKYVCPICKEVLRNDHELTRHIRSHNTSGPSGAPNTCTICGKVLSSQSSLDRHMLVHSGERPFMCRVCNMSFTTNGNMHRHTRIHEKELENGGTGSLSRIRGPAKRKSNASLSKSDLDLSFTPEKRKMTEEFVDASYLQLTQRSLPLESSDSSLPSSPIKPVSFADISLENINNYGNITGPDFTDQDSMTKPSPVKNEEEDTGEGDKDGDIHTCPVCSKTFLCKYGLETHMEVHPNLSLRCLQCNLTFRNIRGLNMHKLMVHNRNRSSSESSNSDQRKNGLKINSIPVGFQDLSFADFSTGKFPLIAKSWCEKNVRRSSSAFHNFVCNNCDMAFPSSSALSLHIKTHTRLTSSRCKECDSSLIDNKALETHMLTHIADKIISGNTENSPVPKEDFLALFQLKSSKSESSTANQRKEETEADISLEDRKQNNHYFVRLGQLAEHYFQRNSDLLSNPDLIQLVQSRKMYIDENDNENDFADIPQILRVTSGVEDLSSLTSNAAKNALFPISSHITMPAATVADNSPQKQMPTLQRMLPVTPRNPASHKQPPPLRYIPAPGLAKGASPAPNHLTLNGHLQKPARENLVKHNELFKCKYCSEAFSNFRALKGHIRTHLGLTPYKCNLCQYSSADKSTLIRHLRTHNGERPFQCLICEYAFTTKANCERHVRKKHSIDKKEEIEKSIGYNQYVSETPKEADKFHSPDTVCKYCGEDFKFFRALKHHLRSHSSCRQKPFKCKACDAGFSTKANAMRHIQKQHTEVQQDLIEDTIHLNENFRGHLDAGNFSGSDESSSVTPPPAPLPSHSAPPKLHPAFHTPLQNMKLPIIPPAALLPPVGILPRPQPSTYITTPPTISIKAETDPDESLEQPLDFSMKSMKKEEQDGDEMSEVSEIKEEILSSDGEDAPMDLSIHSRKSVTAASDLSGSVSRSVDMHVDSVDPDCELAQHLTGRPDYGMLRYKKDYQKYYNPNVGRLQCPFCKMLFKHGLKLQVHIRSHTNERPFRCYHCSAGFTIKTNLDRHLKTRHPQYYNEGEENSKIMEDSPLHSQIPVYKSAVSLSKTGMMAPLKSILTTRKPQDDLDYQPEVTKVYETNNNVIMKDMEAPKSEVSPVSNSIGSDSSCELASVTRILDATNPTNFSAFFVPTDEPSPDDRSPSRMSSSVTETESSLKVNDADVPKRENASKQVKEILKETLEAKELLAAEKREREQKESRESGSETDSPKKKRNSYADAPHKLMCPYCPRAFPWISSLRRHILTHTGQKPFKCPQCPVTFSTKSNRERHLVRKHGLSHLDLATRQMLDRPYKCHLCIYSSFATPGNLVVHYKEKHPGYDIPDSLTKAVTDSDNQRAVESEADLDILINLPIEQRENILENADVDDEDEDEDPASPQLLEHQPDTPESISTDKHINPERDNYNVDRITECWKCNIDYGTRKALLRHLKEHNIDLPFKCYLCDASYDTRRECVDHKISQHGTDWGLLKDKNKIDDPHEFIRNMDKIVEQNFSVDSDMNGTGEKSSQLTGRMALGEPMEMDYAQRKVYCTLCPKRFWSLQDLRRHMRSHTGERPFECDICKKRFTLKHSMMRHRRKHSDTGSPSASDDEDDDETKKGGSSSDVLSKIKEIPEKSWTAEKIQMGVKDVFLKVKRSATNSPSIPDTEDVDSNDNLSNSDMLQNLLGVGSESIEQMLSSADSAKRILGVE